MTTQHTTGRPVRSRAAFYIDGYNWYHSIFKYHPEWKWLNLQSFFESLRPHEEVCAVKLFSAFHLDPAARARQEAYFKALETLPKVKIILGLFQHREVSCRAACGQKYTVPDEKKTDVNLAVELMNDAFLDAIDSFYVVSSDSDMQPPLEWIAKNKPEKKLMVYVPSLPNEQSSRRTDYFKTRGINVGCAFLPLSDLKSHQLRHTVSLGDGKFACRPESWKKIERIS